MKRDEFKGMSKNDLEREVLRLREMLAQQMAAAPGVGAEVTVQGIVSRKTREPIVDMRAGEAHWQMTPAKARQHALIIFDAAVEAERDAATITFLEGTGLDEEDAGRFLTAMRDHRKDWFAEFQQDWSHVQPTTVPKGPDAL